MWDRGDTLCSGGRPRLSTSQAQATQHSTEASEAKHGRLRKSAFSSLRELQLKQREGEEDLES